MKQKEKLINIKGLIIAIIIFTLFYFSAYFQLIPILIFNIKEVSGSTQVILSTFSNIVLLLILFLIFRKELIKEGKKFKINF